MKTKYVYSGLISLYVNFHYNRSTILHVKICEWGERKKSRFVLKFQNNF